MTYSKKLRYVQKKIQEYITTILKVYGNELLLLLEDYNLLQNPHNCIKSSTAPGFILEEFIISKLAIFTQDHDGEKEIIIKRNDGSTTTSSYDCYVDFKNVRILINHKAEKEGRTNAGIAAINKLYNDYVLSEPKQEKAFLVLKLTYKYIVSSKDNQRKFFISNINSFFLEEIDFSKGHKQDHRNWSKDFKKESGRLIVDETFKKEHSMEDKKMSFLNTKKFIVAIKEQDKE